MDFESELLPVQNSMNCNYNSVSNDSEAKACSNYLVSNCKSVGLINN